MERHLHTLKPSYSTFESRRTADQASAEPASDQALGRSRGGLNTKIHLAVRGLDCPVRFALTAGRKGDAPLAEALLKDLPAEVILADAAYDSDRLRTLAVDKGAGAIIPNNLSRAKKHDLDETLYKERHLVECCFAELKRFRRVATRHEKTARNYAAFVTIAATVLSLR